MAAFTNILVATDFGSASARAVRLAAELAKDHGAKLTLMHVLDDSITLDPDSFVPLVTNIPEKWEHDARARLVAEAAELSPGCVAIVRHGEAHQAIVAEATAARADLVVVGTHGKRGATRWLLGSVAERVARTCPCPVLTVRGHAHEAHAPAPSPAREPPSHLHDSSVIKIDSARSPIGDQGQKYLAGGVRVAMRLWEAEPPGESVESERDYEVVGYVMAGRAELHVEGQMVRLEPGDSYVVPRHARHHYRILAPFTAVEATSPSAAVHGRDKAVSSRSR